MAKTDCALEPSIANADTQLKLMPDQHAAAQQEIVVMQTTMQEQRAIFHELQDKAQQETNALQDKESKSVNSVQIQAMEFQSQFREKEAQLQEAQKMWADKLKQANTEIQTTQGQLDTRMAIDKSRESNYKKKEDWSRKEIDRLAQALAKFENRSFTEPVEVLSHTVPLQYSIQDSDEDQIVASEPPSPRSDIFTIASMLNRKRK